MSQLILVKDIPWLLKNISNFVAIDASWHMPSSKRNAHSEYLNERIPGARHFDIDTVADKTSNLPHMLPTTETDFDSHMNRFGISNKDKLLIYDSVGIFSSCRVYWTFLVFGHENVSILDGGLPLWKKAGGKLDSSKEDLRFPTTEYKSKFNSSLLTTYEQILEYSEGSNPQQVQIIDARPSGRFLGTEPEPRAGLPSGSIPKSINIPFKELLANASDAAEIPIFKSTESLTQLFQSHKVDLNRPIVTTCGSGVTASILFVALRLCGARQVSVYDGSWTEYAQRRFQS